ncbi:hypothetical protein Nepgr_018530 [Nepenthes gracilis]|uniref:Kinesin motor domain-containing protein n=1 Tax=Nepenthes gracilis TaxID=150966 RepID=A0AAD3STL0_NEPGR|nr:hypothetical protein Nepgr_018530 [Nepenthes gracilis]
MGAIIGDELMQWDTQGSRAPEERIFVSIRLRPLNAKETATNDFSDWEYINNTTILFKNCLGERSTYPNAYTFDRVFGCDCSTKQVYEEAAKEVALSVINGFNASIFAYGQTSSGKTYTMGGITQYSTADIYDYMEKHHKEREFVLKFSAMEIYNESVRDLLSTDSTPLRLLDDPDRGTVVEKLTEETLKDQNHLLELLSVCEAQRQVGETSLNETSSRSHQILRLTVESSARQFLGTGNSSNLSANVNFVDLAGSERASQTSSGGARLKEGCHINRSLLTLGKVIRNLSKGRNGHVPYRDSKLTRILQNSLGGNSRTAIICTLSPAHSHIEQSRNTLLFASCAKEVTTTAQVNVVMSDKALVKQLRKELGRLEGELKNMSLISATGDFAEVLREKELQIQKMDKEIKELSRQRDLAQCRVEELLRSSGQHQDQCLQLVAHQRKISWLEESSVTSDASDYQRLDADLTTSESFSNGDLDFNIQQSELNFESRSLSGESSPQLLSKTIKFVGPDPCQDQKEAVQRTNGNDEDYRKEVRCIEVEKKGMNYGSITNSPEEGKHKQTLEEEKEEQSFDVVEDAETILSPIKAESHFPIDYGALVKRIMELQRTIDRLVNRNCSPVQHSPCSTESDLSSCGGFNLSRSRSSRAVLMTITSSHGFDKTRHKPDMPLDDALGGFSGRLRGLHWNPDLNAANDSESSGKELWINSTRIALMDQIKKDSKTSGGIDRSSTHSPYVSPNDAAKLKSQRQEGRDVDDNHAVKAMETATKDNISKDDVRDTSDEIQDAIQSTSNWPHEDEGKGNEYEKSTGDDDAMFMMQGDKQSTTNWIEEFERQQAMIIELWDACNTSLVHRTCFFLLFKVDPSDLIYIEVELRRLSFIKREFSQGVKIMMNGQILTPSSSARALNQEREILSKQMLKKFSAKEREALFKKWGVRLDSKKRRLQLANRLWTNTKDIEHIRESATLIAKLVAFRDEDQVPKEMFVGPNFTPQPIISRRSYSWKV